jgi:hypothetical protein
LINRKDRKDRKAENLRAGYHRKGDLVYLPKRLFFSVFSPFSAVELLFLGSCVQRDDAFKTMEAHQQTWTKLVPSRNVRMYGTSCSYPIAPDFSPQSDEAGGGCVAFLPEKCQSSPLTLSFLPKKGHS